MMYQLILCLDEMMGRMQNLLRLMGDGIESGGLGSVGVDGWATVKKTMLVQENRSKVCIQLTASASHSSAVWHTDNCVDSFVDGNSAQGSSWKLSVRWVVGY
mmetsp:Transcript_11606/g.21452  ORF Transcript_11606/g.21452 Transcript_11606/m.21452 type:complete len:102 (+) Transcript_11606:346-651(+)